MPLPRNRDKNQKASGLKMSKKNATMFKNKLRAKNHMDVEMVEEYVEQMVSYFSSCCSCYVKEVFVLVLLQDTSEINVLKPTEEPKKKTDQSTKKRVLRRKRQEELRAFIKEKAKKKKTTLPDFMDADKEKESEEAEVRKPKVNEKRLRKADLPIILNAKTKPGLAVNEKELKRSNVVTARRLSKKKAKKMIKAQKRSEREKEKKLNGMEI